MKTLIIYSSKTGNTRSIAEAIHEALPDSDILPVENAPAPETLPGEYGMVCVGYWVDKGMPDAKARAYLENLRGVRAPCSARWAHGRTPNTPETASEKAKLC